MIEYKNRYRVVGELYLDKIKNKVCVSDAYYVPCYGGIQIYRYDENTLAIYLPNVSAFNARVRILNSTKIKFTTEDFDDCGIIYFAEKDLAKILKLKVGKSDFIKPVTKGKNIAPQSVKNIPQKYRDDPTLFEG